MGTMTKIEKLKGLRLLPPPANELVPLLSTILVFALLSSVTKTVAHDDLAMIWSQTVESVQESKYNLEPRDLFVYGMFGLYMIMYWGYSFLVFAFECTVPALQHFKIQPNEPITSWKDIAKMTPLVVFNQVVLGIPLLHLFVRVLSQRTASRGGLPALVMEVPSIFGFVRFMMVHVVCVEVWFYGAHRLLHSNRFLYSKIHWLHHSYKAPSGFESAYVHPVEFAVNSFPVLWIGPIVTACPLMVTYFWIWMVTFLQVHDHCGYWVPFLPRVLMHDYHHQQPQCCFGILGLLDGVLGTSGRFNTYLKEQEESCRCGEKDEHVKSK